MTLHLGQRRFTDAETFMLISPQTSLYRGPLQLGQNSRFTIHNGDRVLKVGR
jgi:hypothetical protein